MRVYRFRSIDALLDKFHELEDQTIYFASPDELNDPMEGFRDIIWRGDKIVWTNFFKHFVYCLLVSYLQLEKAGVSEELSVDDIPISGRWDQISTPQTQRLFDDIWHRSLNLPKMPEIIEALSNSKHEIRYRELGYYLRMIQHASLIEIAESCIIHGSLPKSKNPLLLEELSVQEIFESILHSIILLEAVKTDERSNVALRQIEAIDNKNRIILQKIIQKSYSSISTETSRKNSQLVIADFPRIYLKEMERLLWPKWYTACFMENYHNSSVWGNYGDKHSGACLIFETIKIGKSNSLRLSEVIGKKVRVIPFYKVVYADKLTEVDFFRSLGGVPISLLMQLWYTDEKGNISKCAHHFQSGGYTDAWLQNYRCGFYRDITTKTKDWKYEQEWRLILDNRSEEFDERKNRTLSYDFNSLKGIIFGINTPDEDRLRIIDIIERKCRENNRTDFKYYQAHYSPETRDIRKHEIQVNNLL